MRMKYVYYLLKRNIETLENFQLVNDPYKIGNTTNNRGKVCNWQECRLAFLEIKRIPMFNDFCTMVLENSFFATEKDEFYIPYDTYQKIQKEYNYFFLQVNTVISFFDSVGFSETEYGFDVKMPATDDFDEFSKNVDLFNKALNQCPFLCAENEKIKLKKTDIGSIWFEFFIIATSGSIILVNLAKIIDKCIKIMSHYKTFKQQEELYHQAKIGTEQLKTIVDCNTEVIKALTDKCIQELKEEIPTIEIKDDGNERVRYTLDTLVKLMDKGMEIYASVDASQEVKDLFPTSDELIFLPKPRKLLEDKEE